MPVNIKGKVYTTVAERINDLAEATHGHYSLTTEIVQFSDELAVMKATISVRRLEAEVGDDGSGVSLSYQNYTGHAFERRDDKSSMVNKTSHLENAETSAIGRALAAAGFGGGEYASADEVGFAIQASQKGATTRQDKEEPHLPAHEPELATGPKEGQDGPSAAEPADIEDARRMLQGAAHYIKVAYPSQISRVFDAAEYFGVPYVRGGDIYWDQLHDLDIAKQMLNSLHILRNKAAASATKSSGG